MIPSSPIKTYFPEFKTPDLARIGAHPCPVLYLLSGAGISVDSRHWTNLCARNLFWGDAAKTCEINQIRLRNPVPSISCLACLDLAATQLKPEALETLRLEEI